MRDTRIATTMHLLLGDTTLYSNSHLLSGDFRGTSTHRPTKGRSFPPQIYMCQPLRQNWSHTNVACMYAKPAENQYTITTLATVCAHFMI